MCLSVVVRYQCTRVPRPCPCHHTKPNQTILPSFVVKLPPAAPTTKKLRSSDIVGLIRVDPFLIESFILASLRLRCNLAVCFPSLTPSSQDHPILIVTTWQHVSRANSLLCSQSAASQPSQPTAQPQPALREHQLPPTTTTSEQVQRPPPRADKTPVHQPNLFFRTKGPRHNHHHHAHELSRTPPTSHCHTMVHGTMLLGAGPRGVSRHTNVCASLLAHSARAAVSSKLVQGLTPYEAHLEPGP